MLRFLFYSSLAVACLIAIAGIGVGLFLATTPRPTNIKGCLTTEMYHVHLCPSDPSYVRFKDISNNARNAVIVSEDAAFYGHHGFDWDEMKNSFELNVEKGGFARGGSTITQQLAKNLYLSKEKSLLRKAREALITIQIEDQLSKDEILEKYLNVVEFGEGLYGIGNAAQFYFKKPASQLSPAEGAFLAFLLPNPKKYSSSFRKKQLTSFAFKQTSEIVNRLFRFKRISAAEHEAALAQVRNLFGGEAEPALAKELPEATPSPEESEGADN